MDGNLYDLMDWAGIEEIVYSEAANPHEILGPHVTEQGLLIQAFIPTAESVIVRFRGSGKEYPMELADEAGFLRLSYHAKPQKLIPCWLLTIMGHQKNVWIPIPFQPFISRKTSKSLNPEFTTASMKKWGRTPCLQAEQKGYTFLCGLPVPCVSAWLETLTCGMAGVIR